MFYLHIIDRKNFNVLRISYTLALIAYCDKVFLTLTLINLGRLYITYFETQKKYNCNRKLMRFIILKLCDIICAYFCEEWNINISKVSTYLDRRKSSFILIVFSLTDIRTHLFPE